jgi:Fe2+ transport system protein FeoA
MNLPLTDLRNGETGVITSTDFSSGHRGMCGHKARKQHWRRRFSVERFAKRLSDMGLTPGTKVTVVKSAPFNGPLEVNVRGSRLAIGRGMASRILVDVER